jgi:hypothetical protein
LKLPRRVFGIPLHPILVHFPIALWVTALLLDVAALYAGPEPWWTLALWATVIGVLIGALAIATGLLEYLEPPVAGIDTRLAARDRVNVAASPFYDFLHMLRIAIEQEKSFDAVAVKRAMDSIEGYRGLLGTLSFSAARHAAISIEDMTMATLLSGRDPAAMNLFRKRAT